MKFRPFHADILIFFLPNLNKFDTLKISKFYDFHFFAFLKSFSVLRMHNLCSEIKHDSSVLLASVKNTKIQFGKIHLALIIVCQNVIDFRAFSESMT